jgi:citrate synthase
VKSIAIYVEGGGDTVQQKVELRTGFDALLSAQKDAARAKRLGWKLVFCGGRTQTHDAFINASRQSSKDELILLLVDSEGPVKSETADKKQNAIERKNHLSERDRWDLKDIPPQNIHLMIQCMEAWIVADAEALIAYYQKDFHQNKLPNRTNLEEEPKESVYKKLAEATRDTKKGEYGKIKHASQLLALIDPAKVASRCPRFKTFAEWLNAQIDAC